MAGTIASMPVAAVTAGGSPERQLGIEDGPSRAGGGARRPLVFSVDGVVTIAIGVTSDPVPAVVWHTRTSGSRARVASPTP